MGEFELIEKFFTRGPHRKDVLLGIGDDAALVDPGTAASVCCAVVSASPGCDGVSENDAEVLAHDLVCSAFNRLASRGITPAWFTLALTMPSSRDEWIERFSRALFAAASPCGAALIGGDTTRGPFTATLIAHGCAYTATTAKPFAPATGDALYLTGALGRRFCPMLDAALAEDRGGRREIFPRVDSGIAASAHVSAAADIRRSLAATLKGMLEPFALGAVVVASALPIAEESATLVRHRGGAKLLLETAADSELCFVVGPAREQAFCRAMATVSTPCTRIGVVSGHRGVRIRDALDSAG